MTGLLLFALFVGLLLPLQAGINSQLRLYVGHPLWASLVSFTGGTLALVCLLALNRISLPPVGWFERVPWWQLTGGLLGALFVTAALMLAPRLGAATLVASVVAGQMVGSMVIDHYGIVGYPQHDLSVELIMGMLLVIIGVALIQYK